MKFKFLKTLGGDRKYFAIVFFILILIFLSGIFTPFLINSKRQNWDIELKSSLASMETYVNNKFNKKETELLSTLQWLKRNLAITLKSNTYEYRELIQLVNTEDKKQYSLEIAAPNGKLIAWNENPVIEQNEIFPLAYPFGETYFYSNGLKTYLTIVDTVQVQNDIFYVIVSYLIEKNYYLQNKYYTEVSFQKEISDKFLTQCTIDYNPFSPPERDGRVYSFPLLNNKNSKVGQVNIYKPSFNSTVTEIKNTSAKVQGLLVVLACFFIVLGFRKDFAGIKSRFFRLIISIISLSIIRVLFFIVGFPSLLMKGPFTNPAYFSSTFAWGIVKSPIEFFVTNLFLIVIALQMFKYIYRYSLEEKHNRFLILKILTTPFFAIIFYYLLRALSASIKSVIFDSTIRYFKEPTPIPNVNIMFMNLNVLMLGSAIILAMAGILILIGKYWRLLEKGENSNLKFVLFFLLIVTGGYFFFDYQPEPLITPLLVVLFISALCFLVYFSYFRSHNYAQNVIYSTIVASIITATMMNFFNLQLEKQSLKTVAFEIIRANKNLINYMIDETLRSTLRNNELVESYFRANINYNAEAFKVWAGSPMQRESMNSGIFLYDEEMNEMGKFSVGINASLTFPDSVLIKGSSEPQIFLIKNNSNGSDNIYAGLVPVMRKGMVSGYVAAVVEFSIQNIGSRNFPDFLESNKTLLGSVIDVSLLKIFEFTNGKLTQLFGDIYPSREQMIPILNTKLTKFNEAWINFTIYNNNYIAYIIKLSDGGEEKLITVAVKDKQVTWDLFNFFKIFLVHSLIILILFLLMLFTKALRIQQTFRSRLLLAFLFVSVIPIALLAVYNREIVSTSSEKAIFEELNNRSDYLERHVTAQLTKHTGRDYVTAFKNAAKELDISFGVYENSNLLYSSRENLYKTGLFGNKLNPQAYFNLFYLNYREFLSKEHLDKFIFDAYYRKIRINNTPLILSVNDAFNKIRPAFATSDIDVILFGIYSFAVIIIIIVSMILANQISAPIRRLTKATEAVAQGDLNISLVNKETGEMKDLYDGFNSMTAELQNKQIELAELERETAWKEMAKQVAHEIKNPLTPIKLAIQQLVASYKEKRQDFDSILDRVTTTTLHQIDNLSQIASEFSNFAKMPSIKLTVFDMLPVIKDTLNLFVHERVKIKLNTKITLAKIEADVSQLRRMIINLVRNSIQANASEITVQLIQKDNNYLLIISDDGEGIKEEFKNKIFNMNFTTKEKGMGIGLKLAKRFLDGIGGKIELVSSNEKGTTFEISIPVFTEPETAS